MNVAMAIDEEGYSLVCEYRGNCVSIFDPQGNKIHTVDNLSEPCGIALDPISGSLYVAASGYPMSHCGLPGCLCKPLRNLVDLAVLCPSNVVMLLDHLSGQRASLEIDTSQRA